MDCNFQESLTCQVCGFVARHSKVKRNCPRAPMPVRRCLAGCHLSRLLAKFGIVYTADCPCKHHADEMDANGVEWCEANLPIITGWMRDEAEKRGLPFIEFAARKLVRIAIARARAELVAHE